MSRRPVGLSVPAIVGWYREGEEGEEGVDVLYQCRKKRLGGRDGSSAI